MIPELRARWGRTEAIEVSDRTTPAELELVRAMSDNYDAIAAGIFVRASSGSGRLDLAPQVVRLLQDLARASERRGQPFVAVFFGNPYAPMFVQLWQRARHQVAVPPGRRAVLSIGGELSLWHPWLVDWLHWMRKAAPTSPCASRSACPRA